MNILGGVQEASRSETKCDALVFAATDNLKFILSWPENHRIRAEFEAFNIELNQTVTGRVQLTVNVTNDLSSTDKTLLTTHGFIEQIQLTV